MVDGPAADDIAGAFRHAAMASVADLYESHYTSLARLALQLVGDRETAEDVVQDVFVALHRRGDPIAWDDPQRYLVTAVVNRSRSALRRRRVARAFRPDRPRTAEAADAASLRAAEHSRVLGALDRLPRRQREVLVLRYYRDLSIAEIATVLGISSGAVSTSLSRGLKALPTHLGRNP